MIDLLLLIFQIEDYDMIFFIHKVNIMDANNTVPLLEARAVHQLMQHSFSFSLKLKIKHSNNSKE